MGAFTPAWDPEQEYRRHLLAAAREGKAKASEELQREYNVRVYSAIERAELDYERDVINTASGGNGHR